MEIFKFVPHGKRTLRYAAAALGVCLTASCSEDSLTRVPTVENQFEQRGAEEVDILWVIDNSGSMADDQAALALDFDTLLGELSQTQLDVEMGVVSTDPVDRGLLHTGPSGIPVIETTETRARTLFAENVGVGTAGSGDEKGLETAALVLGRGLHWREGDPVVLPNAEFPRENAALFIVVVSDEEDGSFGPVRFYSRLFESAKGAGNEALVSVSAVVGPPGGCFSEQRGSALAGLRYIDLANQTGGIVSSICEPFATSLLALADTVHQNLLSAFRLSNVPLLSANIECQDLGTVRGICVTTDGMALPSEDQDGPVWSYESSNNSIVFEQRATPTPGAQIVVRYRYL